MRITSMTIEGAKNTLTVAVEGDGLVRVRDGQRLVCELDAAADLGARAAELHQVAEGYRGTQGDICPYALALERVLNR
jgi:hypothetical protein